MLLGEEKRTQIIYGFAYRCEHCRTNYWFAGGRIAEPFYCQCNRLVTVAPPDDTRTARIEQRALARFQPTRIGEILAQPEVSANLVGELGDILAAPDPLDAALDATDGDIELAEDPQPTPNPVTSLLRLFGG